MPACRTVVPATLSRPKATSRRYQHMEPRPKTRAGAQNGTPKARKNCGSLASSA
ncbi:hypothetical protein OJF2_05500 [Aquisphaera giovannonii]|uniref:Uncharacterized protein n=1 Tax=Aquisphaera giovannonii TaxID=406548 RepID=A0A5B9VW50_9BACT|nr:hypothetical protein OJF2_05500 [Aquisphaera giovannonii]